MEKLPKFEDLPLGKDDPMLSAWGLYGADDQLGTLNRLTEDVVLEAAKEIKTGVRVSLNWPMGAQTTTPFFGRQAFHQEILSKSPRTVNDDVWTMNSQCSSQWDGLRHFGYQTAERFYNNTSMSDIHAPNSTQLGIHHVSKRGIVGRGILVDYARWARLNPSAPSAKDYDPLSTSPITLEDLEACLEFQGTKPRFGDILLVRSGFVKKHAELASTESGLSHLDTLAKAGVQNHAFGGIQQSKATLKWIWEHFSAVAGDMPSFEMWPTQEKWLMHEVLLAGWGCPIGELFDLEELSREAERQGRWAFFVTSEVVNVVGGVASPPNILAIF